jgi:uncharacterized protein (TIGR03067 family)
MKRFLSGLLVVGICLAAYATAAEEKDAVKKDLELLQGEWLMLMPDGSGKVISDSKRVCKENETTVAFGGRLAMKAKFTIDPAKKPKTIDYELLEGDDKGKKRLGIYELDGDTVKFCFGPTGGPRPNDFISKLGEGQSLSAWKRDKK